MNWSPYQNAIFDAVAHTDDSLTIEAVAGSGKTSTIVEAINHVPEGNFVCFLAFNKLIADELKRRITAPHAKCMTLHSAGYGAWRKFLGQDSFTCELNSRKTSEIAKEILTVSERVRYGAQLGKLIGIAKGAGLVPESLQEQGYEAITEDDDATWDAMIDFYGLDSDECSVPVARAVLKASIEKAREVIDFDDQLFMPVIVNAAFQQYDVVFLDEAQDVNSLQIEMVKRMVRPGGRVIAVGDRHQAIYGWRGALSNSMDVISNMFHSRSLPLSVSYRCPRNVVKHAQEFVSHILPHDAAPEGLTETPTDWKLTWFRPTDAILCRVNRPLIEMAFMFIRNKIPCRVLGRDIGKGLISIINKMKAQNIEDLEVKLKIYKEREERKADGDESKLAALYDKLATLNVFIEEMALDGTVGSLVVAIENLFSDDGQAKNMLTLSSVHKSKGLEFERVFVLDAHLYMPSKWARQPWQQIQEKNLQYVAATRAKMELRYVSSDLLRLSDMSNRAVSTVTPAEAL